MYTWKWKTTKEKNFDISHKLINVAWSETPIVLIIGNFQVGSFKGTTNVLTTIPCNEKIKLQQISIQITQTNFRNNSTESTDLWEFFIIVQGLQSIQTCQNLSK